MKDLFIYTLMLLFSMGIHSVAYSQSAKMPKNKEVTVHSEIQDGVKKTKVQVKADGDEKTYSWEGDNIPVEIQQELDALDINIDFEDDEEKNVSKEHELHQSIENDVKNKKQIKVIIEDNGAEKNIEWEGDDEIPAEIRKELEELEDLHDEKIGRKKIIIKSDDGSEKVFEWEGDEMPEEVRESIGDREVEQQIDLHVKRAGRNKAFLGIAMAQSIEETTENGVTESNTTLTIDHIVPGSGAEKASLLKDDELLKINGTAITSADQVLELLAPFAPGDEITVTIKRSGEVKDFKVILSAPLENTEERKEIIVKKEVIKKEFNEESPATQQIIKQSGSLQLEELKIHPNPSDGKLSIYFKSRPISTKVSVSDLSGKLLYEKNIDNFEGVFQEEISLEKMPKGALLIKIEQGGKIETKKIMHQ